MLAAKVDEKSAVFSVSANVLHCIGKSRHVYTCFTNTYEEIQRVVLPHPHWTPFSHHRVQALAVRLVTWEHSHCTFSSCHPYDVECCNTCWNWNRTREIHKLPCYLQRYLAIYSLLSFHGDTGNDLFVVLYREIVRFCSCVYVCVSFWGSLEWVDIALMHH